MAMASASNQKSKAMLRRGAWSSEEDQKLVAYIKRYGIWNWSQMAKPAGIARSGKSCRLRWLNYLRPGIKRGDFSKEEEDAILKFHAELGNRWSAIAAKLPGRTDNEVKNYWHTNLKKRIIKSAETVESTEGTTAINVTNLSSGLSVSSATQQTEQSNMSSPYAIVEGQQDNGGQIDCLNSKK